MACLIVILLNIALGALLAGAFSENFDPFYRTELKVVTTFFWPIVLIGLGLIWISKQGEILARKIKEEEKSRNVKK